MTSSRFTYTLLLLFSSFALQAQLYPGDANDNGRVDNIDILFVGYAYGTFGPSRISAETAFDEQEIALLWQEWFPNGTNYAYADTDGDGIISFLDFSVVFINYALEASIVNPTPFVEGDPLFDPQLRLGASNAGQITGGSIIEMPIILGTPDRPVNDLNGLAFSLLYDENLISDISIEFYQDSWLGTQDMMVFQREDLENGGQIDVGLSRLGANPVTGEGEIGVVSIIIQEDLVGFIPEEADSAAVFVELGQIVGVNSQFEEIAIAGDYQEMMVYTPNALTNTITPILEEAVEIFPNPTPATVQVNCRYGIEQVQVYDILGKELARYEQYNTNQMELQLEVTESSVRILKIATPLGIVSRRVLVQPN
ncbi:MAG: hypothetical protein AAF798_10470 [Bacteroidota bacterium]